MPFAKSEDEIRGSTRGFRPECGGLSMPVPCVNSGTTGMLYSEVHDYPADHVLKFIKNQAIKYPPYQKEIWDCEDHAFLVAADIRCRFPGQPVGVAIGIAAEPEKIKGAMHAVNYIWFMERDNRTHELKCADFAIFDASLPNPRFVKGFKPEVIIPFPVSGLKKEKDCPPGSGLVFRSKASFQLDRKLPNFNLMPDVQKTLNEKSVTCPKPAKIEFESDNHWPTLHKTRELWSYRDDMFYAFAQIRKKHMGAPVGVAFGSATFGPSKNTIEDYAALVLWESANKFKYWDYKEKAEPKDFGFTFDPRIVIV